MNYKNNEIKFTLILATLSLISTFFLFLTKIEIADFLTINIFPLIQKTLSIYFLVFVISISIIISISFCASKRFESKKAKIIILPTWIISSLIGLIIFNKLDFLIVFLFSTIGLFLLIKSSENESTFSSGFNSAKKVTLFFSIGLFISILLITFPNASEFEENFNKDLLNTTIGEEDNFKAIIEDSLITAIISTQKETINSIENFQSYKTLQEKEDIDAQNFITQINSLKTAISSKEYENQIKETLPKDNNLGNTILAQMPIIQNISKLSWIIYPLSGLVLSISLFGIVVQILTGIIYTLLRKIVNKPKKEYGLI